MPVHARIQEFFQGGVGGGEVSGPTVKKQSGQQWQGVSNGIIKEKTILFQGSRGVQHFSRGVQMLISKETHIACDFPGGGGPDPLSLPLDPHI